jgi:hypothetical protein
MDSECLVKMRSTISILWVMDRYTLTNVIFEFILQFIFHILILCNYEHECSNNSQQLHIIYTIYVCIYVELRFFNVIGFILKNIRLKICRLYLTLKAVNIWLQISLH